MTKAELIEIADGMRLAFKAKATKAEIETAIDEAKQREKLAVALDTSHERKFSGNAADRRRARRAFNRRDRWLAQADHL